MSATKGNILISYPFLGDANFERSVVLLCENNDSGSFGFILNKSTDLTLNEVIDKPLLLDCPIYLGGPVAQDAIFFIVQQDQPLLKDSTWIAEDIYWGGDFDHLLDLLSKGEYSGEQCRFFLGYSGWSDGQLESELQSDAWIVSDINPTVVLHTQPNKMWQQSLITLGGKYKQMANYPIDPRLN
ncbi:MAG: YqgE/AlgH family protein [Cytophagaceae bacterium]|jgi:putative transcriptional regulator|nr:YqgE/AlgH family protein [Cytophagaceae bacterium]